MGSSKKIAKGVFWTTLVNVINGIYGFVSVPILIGYYGKSDYGLIGLALSVNVYLRLMDMGLNSTNIRFFSNWLEKGNKEDVSKLFQTSLVFYGLIGLVNSAVLIILSFYSEDLFQLSAEQDVILKHLFYILAISAFINWYTSCFDQLIRANEFIGWTQKVGLIPKICQIVILIYTITIGLSIEKYYALTAFSMFIILPICIIKIKKICPYISFVPKFNKPIFGIILPYSLNIFSFGLFQFSANYLRPVLLGIQGSIESVTDYRILHGIINIVLMLGGAFTSIFLPSASRAVARNDKSAQNKVAYDGTKYITIVLCMCCFGVMCLSKELIIIYVGEEYTYLVIWLNLWLFATLATHNQAISSLILSGSDIRAITYCTIISSMLGLVVTWFSIPIFGVGGTVIGYFLYLFIQIAFFYFYYWPHKLGINSRLVFTNSFAPYVVVGSLVALLVANLNISDNCLVNLITKGTLFALTYITIIWFMMNSNDRVFIKNIINKKTFK